MGMVVKVGIKLFSLIQTNETWYYWYDVKT
jgi:hypothetical protein